MELTAKGRETKTRVLEAALTLFSENGYKSTTTKEVARQAGIAEGTLFRYFPSKKSLLHGILEPLLIYSLSELHNEAEKLAFPQALEFIIQKRLQLIEENLPLFKVLFFEAGFQPELRRHIIQEIVIPMRKAIVPFFIRRMDQGEIRRMDPFVALQMMFGMMVSFFLYKYVVQPLPGDERIHDEQLLTEMLKIFYQGVGVHD